MDMTHFFERLSVPKQDSLIDDWQNNLVMGNKIRPLSM